MELTVDFPETVAKRLVDIPSSDRQRYIIEAVEVRQAQEKADYDTWFKQEIENSIEEEKEGVWILHEEVKERFRKIGLKC
ncbi:MAG: hypothetical protein HQL71_10255 [Magnetococcales bacterium]|nr:hypothetical protein [Magnetococcales bacterium]